METFDYREKKLLDTADNHFRLEEYPEAQTHYLEWLSLRQSEYPYDNPLTARVTLKAGRCMVMCGNGDLALDLYWGIIKSHLPDSYKATAYYERASFCTINGYYLDAWLDLKMAEDILSASKFSSDSESLRAGRLSEEYVQPAENQLHELLRTLGPGNNASADHPSFRRY